MDIQELMIAYKVISKFMNENQKNYDNSFKTVKNLLANQICEQLDNVDLNKLK